MPPAATVNAPKATGSSLTLNVVVSSVPPEMLSVVRPLTFTPSVAVAEVFAMTSESILVGVVVPAMSEGEPPEKITSTASASKLPLLVKLPVTEMAAKFVRPPVISTLLRSVEPMPLISVAPLKTNRLAPPLRVPLLARLPASVCVRPVPEWKMAPLPICKSPANVQFDTGEIPAAWVLATSTVPRESAPLLIVI